MVYRGRMPFLPVVVFFFIFAGWKLLPIILIAGALLFIAGSAARVSRFGAPPRHRRPARSSRQSYTQLSGRVADRIIDLDDRIAATAPAAARGHYRAGAATFLAARTTSDLRSALADLDAAEAIMEGRPLQPRGTTSRSEALELIERSRYALS